MVFHLDLRLKELSLQRHPARVVRTLMEVLKEIKRSREARVTSSAFSYSLPGFPFLLLLAFL